MADDLVKDDSLTVIVNTDPTPEPEKGTEWQNVLIVTLQAVQAEVAQLRNEVASLMTTSSQVQAVAETAAVDAQVAVDVALQVAEAVDNQQTMEATETVEVVPIPDLETPTPEPPPKRKMSAF